ncbi:diacylglycerol O-acyltransferase 1 [Nematocida ausubeli]|nr:diacylglycerol O-acyltransferase 1 [Nematocida ausubeli]
MDRVHSKCAHSKHVGILDTIEIGRGGWIWILISLLVLNYQIWMNNTLYTILCMVADESMKCLKRYSILTFFLLNVTRWIILYFVSEQLSSVIVYGVISLCIGMESIMGISGASGFIGVIMRYLSVMQLMKGISYILARREVAILGMDDELIEKPKEEISLPRFILFPTMCYQQEYPVASSVSKYMVCMYLLMLPPLILFTYYCFSIKCYFFGNCFWKEPTVDTYIKIFMWCNLGWISGFIMVFIVFFGLLSEITRFNDRSFFEAWWNASVSNYWRKWNSQVHRWIKRHVHRALIKKNITVRSSRITIFLVSGLVHEYIIGDVLKYRGIGFLSMASQVPLDSFIKLGNNWVKLNQEIAVTFAFNFIGAPALVLVSVMPRDFFSLKMK